jgi:hypothetical protein
MIAKRIYVTRLVSFSSGAFSIPTHAVDVTGAWATDSSVRAKVFVKEQRIVAFHQDSELYGGGFIVEDKQLHQETRREVRD